MNCEVTTWYASVSDRDPQLARTMSCGYVLDGAHSWLSAGDATVYMHWWRRSVNWQQGCSSEKRIDGVAEEKGDANIVATFFSTPLLQRPVVPYMRTKKERLNLFHGLQPLSISAPTYSCTIPVLNQLWKITANYSVHRDYARNSYTIYSVAGQQTLPWRSIQWLLLHVKMTLQTCSQQFQVDTCLRAPPTLLNIPERPRGGWTRYCFTWLK